MTDQRTRALERRYALTQAREDDEAWLHPIRGLAWVAEQVAGAERELAEDDHLEFKGTAGVLATHVELEAVDNEVLPAYLAFVRDDAVDPDLRAYALRGLCTYQSDRPELRALLAELREGAGPLRGTARLLS